MPTTPGLASVSARTLSPPERKGAGSPAPRPLSPALPPGEAGERVGPEPGRRLCLGVAQEGVAHAGDDGVGDAAPLAHAQVRRKRRQEDDAPASHGEVDGDGGAAGAAADDFRAGPEAGRALGEDGAVEDALADVLEEVCEGGLVVRGGDAAGGRPLPPVPGGGPRGGPRGPGGSRDARRPLSRFGAGVRGPPAPAASSSGGNP